jgi:putative transposase
MKPRTLYQTGGEPGLRSEARDEVFDYIESFYKAVRRHSAIGYVSLVECERKTRLG